MFLPLLLLRYYDGTRGTDRPWGKWLFYLFTPPTFCCSACWPIFSFRKEVFPLSHRNTRILSGCAALLLCAGLSGCRSVPAFQPSASLTLRPTFWA